MFLGYADAGVGYFDQHVIAGGHDFVAAPHGACLIDVSGADRQGAAALHRVARVDRQIDDDLFELALVDLGKTEIAPVHDLELDIFADQAAQEMRQLDQHIGDVDDARLQGLLPREGQELAHEVGGAVGVLLDLHDVGKGRVARPEPHQQEIAEADHRGQQVVEVVRHAAGELSDRLHLLRLGELDLEVLLVGDVDEVQHETAVAAVAAAKARQKDDARLIPVALEPHIDPAGGRRAIRRRGELGHDLAPVVIVDKADQRLPNHIRRRRAEQLAERPVRLLQPALAIDQRDTNRRVGEEPLKAFARQTQRRLPFALRRQIADDRPGTQFRPGTNDALSDPGLQDVPVPAAQRHLAALLALAASLKRIKPGGLVGRRRRQEIMQPRAACDDFRRCAAEPLRERLIDEQKPAVAIDRVEADRRVIEKIDELVALVVDHRLHLVPRGDVLKIPETVAGPAGDWVDADIEPAGRYAPRIAQRQRRYRPCPRRGPAAQPLEIGLRIRVGEGGGNALQGRFGKLREQVVERRIGIGDAPVRRDDDLRVGRSVERLAQDVDAAGQRGVHRPRGKGGKAADHRQRDNRTCYRLGLGPGNDVAGEKRPDQSPRGREEERDIAEPADPTRLLAFEPPIRPAAGAFDVGDHAPFPPVASPP